MTTISARLATLEDLPSIAQLFNAYRQFYEQPDDLNLATAFIGERMRRRESVIIVADNEAGQAMGFCQLYPTFCSVEAQPIFSLYDLFVSPSARKTGAGKMLMQAAQEQARLGGFVRMDLTTAKTNLPAQALYASLGWTRDEVFFGYNKAVPR
jgi:ribosomal protein S18 acetylase RimI-like enzyme